MMTKNEALEQEPLNLNCKSVQKRLATQWGYVEQPAQEPVAWMNDIAYSDEIDNLPANRGEIIPLYTHPAPSWQGLSDDEDDAIIQSIWSWGNDFPYDKYRVCIEQALRNKNG